MNDIEAYRKHWAQKRPYIGGKYSNPKYFQNIADKYSSNSYDPFVINGSVFGQKNMPWYMHIVAVLSIMVEGYSYGSRGGAYL